MKGWSNLFNLTISNSPPSFLNNGAIIIRGQFVYRMGFNFNTNLRVYLNCHGVYYNITYYFMMKTFIVIQENVNFR
jgi:hypothetical protein